MNESEAAWASGLFEGEGYIGYNKTKNIAALTIVMTDEEPIRRFAEIVGVNASGPHAGRQDHHKPTWRVSISKRQTLRELLEMFRQWLSPRRITQFENALNSIVVHRVRQGESGFLDCKSITPGSQAGYRRHRTRGELACDHCMEQYRIYMKNLRNR